MNSMGMVFFESQCFTTVTTWFILVGIIVATALLADHLRLIWKCGPGPWGLPVFGFYPYLRKDFYVHLTELVKKYGDVYLFFMFGKLYLHLGSHTSFREVFVEKSDCFTDRTTDIGVFQHLFKDGIAFLNGEPWRVWRKFVLRSMKKLHMIPKGDLEGPFLDAIEASMLELRERQHEAIDLSALIGWQCTKAFQRKIVGDKVNESTAARLNQIYQETTLLVGRKQMLLCGEIARYFILNRSKEFRTMLIAKDKFTSILQQILDDHRLVFDPEHPSDLIDLYLKERKLREDSDDPQAKYFNDRMFMGTLALIYGESCLSLGVFITNFLRDLALKRDVQDAIYEEIVREIGTERLPCYQDKDKLPYTCSVLKEIERMSEYFPGEATRVANCDLTVGNVFVPKGTICVPNALAIHRDPAVYENPDCFDPERFMNADQTKRPMAQTPITFGIGKRSCAGELLIKATLFVFVTAIVQNFIIHTENPNALKDYSHEGRATPRFLVIPRKSPLPRTVQK